MTNILENLNGIAAIGVGVGLMTIVGQCLGAGRKDEAVYYIKKLCVIAEAVIIVSCLIVYILVRPVTILGGMESTSAEMCIHMITWITIVKPVVWTMAFVPGYGLRAAGDVKFSMITSCCTMWACRFCLCVFLIRVLGFGPMGVWIGMFAENREDFLIKIDYFQEFCEKMGLPVIDERIKEAITGYYDEVMKEQPGRA